MSWCLAVVRQEVRCYRAALRVRSVMVKLGRIADHINIGANVFDNGFKLLRISPRPSAVDTT